jgi:hypothetical protein
MTFCYDEAGPARWSDWSERGSGGRAPYVPTWTPYHQPQLHHGNEDFENKY